jgi:hypothetical protein
MDAGGVAQVMSNSFLLRRYGLQGRLSKLLFVAGSILIAMSFLDGSHSRENPSLLFIVGWGMVATAVTFFAAFEQFAVRRMIENLPTSSIRSAPQGYVELSGVVRLVGPKASLKCPMCLQPCIWYVVQRRNSRSVPPQQLESADHPRRRHRRMPAFAARCRSAG